MRPLQKVVTTTTTTTTVVALVGLGVGPARAAAPQHDHVVTAPEPAEICGIQTTVVNVINQVSRDRQVDGNATFTRAGTVKSTFTAANGHSVTFSSSGLLKVTAVDNGDGTRTVTITTNGQSEKVTSGTGRPLLADRGTVTKVFRVVVNDPSTSEDDVFTLLDIRSEHGPHPDLDSGETLFCDVVIPALS